MANAAASDQFVEQFPRALPLHRAGICCTTLGLTAS